MIAMLLAAGRGERLRPLTDHTAKPLIEVGGKSLIEFHLENLQNAGFTKVVINTSWQADKIVEKLGSGEKYQLQIHYSHEPTALETAGGIAKALPKLGTTPFVVISADTWTTIELSTLAPVKPDTLAHLILVPNPAHNPDGDFTLHDSKISLQRHQSQTYTYSGIGVFHPDLFNNLLSEKMPLREVLYPAISAGRVTGEVNPEIWFDIGTIERLSNLRQHLESESE